MKLKEEKFGKLTIPEGSEIIFAEPATIFRVKRAAFLYAQPPTNVVNICKEYLSDDRNSSENYPVPKAKTLALLTPNLEVLARPFAYQDRSDQSKKTVHPFLLEVALFTRDDRSKMTVNEIGYMYADDLIAPNNLREFSMPIFANVVNTRELQNLAAANEPLLAILHAILSLEAASHQVTSGREIIMQLMQQQRDGTTVVRLYDPDKRLPIYVCVQNTYYAQTQSEQGEVNALSEIADMERFVPWFYVLAKAIAVASSSLKKDPQEAYDDSFLALYQSQHSPDVIMRMLTGFATKKTIVRHQISDNHPLDAQNIGLLTAQISLFLHEKIFANINLQKHLKTLAHYQQYRQIEKILTKITASLEANGKTFITGAIENSKIYEALSNDKNLLREFAIYLFILTYYATEIKTAFDVSTNVTICTRKNMLEVLSQLKALKFAPPQAVITAINLFINFYEDNSNQGYHAFSGEILTGEYTKEEKLLFQEIKNALMQNKIVITESYRPMPEKNQCSDKMNRVYAITKAYELNTDQKSICYLTLHNPTILMTANRELQPSNDAYYLAEFTIDVAEFIQYFQTYTIGKLRTQVTISERPIKPADVIEVYEVDIFTLPFENLSDFQREQLLTMVLLKTTPQMLRYIAGQNNIALCELSRHLGDRILILERSIFTSLDAQTIVNELRIYNTFFKELNAHIQKRMGATKVEAFAAIQQKNLEKAAELRNAFTAPITNKQDLIFKLLNYTPTEVNACLAVQPLHDLYEMVRYLEKSIQKKKTKIVSQKDREAKKISNRHVESERKLFNIVKHHFADRILAANTYETIKANADTYLYQKYKRDKIKAIQTFITKLFVQKSNEDKLIEMYKHHLKYKAGFRKELLAKLAHVRNIIKFAKEYYSGEKYDDAQPANYERLAHLLANSIGIKAKQIVSFELSNEGDLYKIVVTTKMGDKKALDVPKEIIENHAIAQYNYKQLLLQTLKASGHKLETLATEHLNTLEGQAKVRKIINPPNDVKITSYRLTKNRSGYTLTIGTNKKYENRTWVNDWVEDYALAQFNMNRQKVIASGLMHL